MISYCHADKELVYRIHQFLTNKGFKTWFDRDNIYGPAMQSMADAVENTEFVILCMSDSYKRSVYCQAEAEYAFHCKRRLLPIIARQGYRADGWLGLIIGSRIYVDFGRLEFNEACESVLKEITLQRENQLDSGPVNRHTHNEDRSHLIQQMIAKDTEPLTSTVIENVKKSNLPNEYIDRNTSKAIYRTMPVREWTTNDILDFLYDTNLHYMMPLCELMTGYGLIKLFRMCQRKSSRFYSQLNDELSLRFNGLHLPVGIFTQFLSEMDLLISSSSESSVHATEQETTQSESVPPSHSVTPPPPPIIVKRVVIKSRPPSLLEPPTQIPGLSPQQIPSPNTMTMQRSCNVQITEQTTYRTESIVTPSMNYFVQSSRDSSTVRSEQTKNYEPEFMLIDKKSRQHQQINSVPYQRIYMMHN